MPISAIIGTILWSVLYLSIAVQITMSRKDSDAKLFWLVFAALFLPLALPLYLLTGIHYRRPDARERLHGRSMDFFQRQMTEDLRERYFTNAQLEQVDELWRPLAHLLLACGEGNKVYAHNSFEIITSGARKRELLLEDIRKAQKYIHLEYFRFGNDASGREVRDALLKKASEGVEVRFINNNMSAWRIPTSYFNDMRKGGMEVKNFTSIRYGWHIWLMRLNHQDHRKMVIIDGKVAYTGGMNINDNYFCRWRDTHLRLEGPAIARLQASFIDTWLSCGGKLNRPLPYYFDIPMKGGEAPLKDKLLQVVTDAPEFPLPSSQLAYEWILQNAREYVYIQTPYFIPPTSFLHALKGAALRGVDVRLMLPKKVDTPLIGWANRSYYEECLEAGVRIFERSGAFIHCKTLVADDAVSIVGATNLDARSFGINNEVNTFAYDRETALACKEIFLDDPAAQEEILLPAWKVKHRKHRQYFSQIIRLFSSLL